MTLNATMDCLPFLRVLLVQWMGGEGMEFNGGERRGGQERGKGGEREGF